MTALDPAKYPVAIRSPGAAGRQYPVVIILHGNFGLPESIARRLLAVADKIAALGYLVAVPRYYPDDRSHEHDNNPKQHVPILEAVAEEVCSRPDAAAGKIGLVGYSLGGGVAMSWMADGAADKVGAFVDFFGYPPRDMPQQVHDFPPTAILHNRNDEVVPFRESIKLIEKLNTETELLLVGYIENNPLGAHHVFAEGGDADVDSIEHAIAWLRRHLPADP